MHAGAEHLKLYRQRIERDEAYIAQLEKDVLAFLALVDIKVHMFQSFMEAA
jgi:hypothetical protein